MNESVIHQPKTAEAPQPTAPIANKHGKPDGWNMVSKDRATQERIARTANGERE